ncbi:hypothetical protein JYT72_02235 [Crocinitomix catalasitica]|nr:hypothetical protein [Crocinitomix catalasitica]
MKIRNAFIYSLSVAVLISMISCGGQETEGETEGTDSTDVVEAAVYDIGVSLVLEAEVPLECEVEDAYVDCHQWTDVNGKNYFLRSLGFPLETGQRTASGDPALTQYIFAYHYRETSDGISLIKEYRDSVVACEFDVMMDHVQGCFFVTDMDEDDIGEITYMYRMTCTSDVSPSTQKLYIIEGNDIYLVLGMSLVLGEGGEYELGAEFSNAPEGFEEHARGIWDDFKDEMAAF